VQPDIVHAHSWLLYSFLPLKRRSGARLVVTLHDYGFFCPRKDLLHGEEVCSGPGPVKCLRCSAGKYGAPKALFIQSGLRLGGHFPDSRIDQYLAVSSFVAKVYSGQAGGAARPGETEQSAIIPLEVVPSFISDAVAHYRPRVRGGLPLPDRDFILFVGALGRHKGLAVLLQAYESLRRSALGTCSQESLVPLVLMGPRWPDTPSHFPEGVTVIHDAPHELVMEAWARCRLGVIPSICAETMGLAALEGLAMGRPVVASRVGGLTDIIRHGETGLLVTPGDVEDLQSAIQTLLNDDRLGVRLGSAGRQHVLNRFTASVVVPRVEEIYARTLADQTTPGAVQSGGHPEAPRESMPPARLAWPEPKATTGNEPLSELGS
jgi:glycosyltransferase involved in cell wall biosynthesis